MLGRSDMEWKLNNVYQADSIDAITAVPSETVHLILSDIPYGIGTDDWDVLHSNTNSAYLGSSPAQKALGGLFQMRRKPINGWSAADREIPRQYYDWCTSWAGEWLRVLKPGASAFIFAGRRLAHRCVSAMEDSGFSYKDMLAWLKQRAPHRAQRISVIFDRRGNSDSSRQWSGWRVGNLSPIFEPILWFVKPYPIGTTIADNVLTYGVGAYNEQAFLRYTHKHDNVLECSFANGESGLHPTQKPISLLKALIELATLEGQLVLDPFCGSGSTVLAAKSLNRLYLGFDTSNEYIEVAKKRLSTLSLPAQTSKKAECLWLL